MKAYSNFSTDETASGGLDTLPLALAPRLKFLLQRTFDLLSGLNVGFGVDKRHLGELLDKVPIIRRDWIISKFVGLLDVPKRLVGSSEFYSGFVDR